MLYKGVHYIVERIGELIESAEYSLPDSLRNVMYALLLLAEDCTEAHCKSYTRNINTLFCIILGLQ